MNHAPVGNGGRLQLLRVHPKLNGLLDELVEAFGHNINLLLQQGSLVILVEALVSLVELSIGRKCRNCNQI